MVSSELERYKISNYSFNDRETSTSVTTSLKSQRRSPRCGFTFLIFQRQTDAAQPGFVKIEYISDLMQMLWIQRCTSSICTIRIWQLEKLKKTRHCIPMSRSINSVWLVLETLLLFLRAAPGAPRICLSCKWANSFCRNSLWRKMCLCVCVACISLSSSALSVPPRSPNRGSSPAPILPTTHLFQPNPD